MHLLTFEMLFIVLALLFLTGLRLRIVFLDFFLNLRPEGVPQQRHCVWEIVLAVAVAAGHAIEFLQLLQRGLSPMRGHEPQTSV